MSADTTIEWTDRTWNPIRGCSLVSEGCRNCYAMKQAHRFSGVGQPYEGLTELGPAGPRWTGKIRIVDEALTEPLRWRKPQRIFVNSMSDLFHEDVPDEFIERVFSVMGLAERHTFQVLTKRPARMLAWFQARRFDVKGAAILQTEIGECHYAMPWPLPNVWVGVSCENQKTADERIPLLLQTPAAVRFVSAEPLIGLVDLEAVPLPAPGAAFYGLTGVAQPTAEKDTEPDDWKYWTRRSAKLDWVIVGGESGPRSRAFNLQWARGIVSQCTDAGVSVFVKQLGANPYVKYEVNGGTFTDPMVGATGLKDRKGGDMSEWPEDLRVRQFPVMQREAVTA